MNNKTSLWIIVIIMSLLCVGMVSALTGDYTENFQACFSFDSDASDSQGLNDGSLQNGAYINSTIYKLGNGSASFDGNDDYANFTATNIIFPTNNSWTINYWTYIRTFPSGDTNRHFTAHRSDEGGTGVTFTSFNNPVGRFENRIRDAAGNLDAGLDVNGYSANTWYMISMTYDGTTFKTYIDGSSISNFTTDFWGFGGHDFIMAAYNSTESTQKADMLIDEFMIWNDSLSSSQILELYDSNLGVSCSSVIATGSSNSVPTSSIQYPSNGTSFEDQTWMNFSLLGTDVENSTLVGKLFIDGVLNATNSSLSNNSAWNINITDFSYGSYNAIFEVDDGSNKTNSSQVSFTLSAAAAPVAPIINLTFDNSSDFFKDYSSFDHSFSSTGGASGTDSDICKWYGCLNLSATGGDYINSTALFDVETMAVSYWVYFINQAGESNPQAFWQMGESSNLKRTQYSTYCFNPSWASTGGEVSTSTSSSGCASAGSWYFVFEQYNGTHYEFWLNDNYYQSSDEPDGTLLADVGDIIRVGAWGGIDTEGYIDEFLVWNTTFNSSFVSDLYESRSEGTPPDLDIFVQNITYDLPFNWSNEHNNLSLSTMPINFTIKNQGAINSTGFFNVSFELNGSVLQTWRINLSAGEETVLEYNWSPSYGYHKGWLTVDTEGEVSEDVESNNVQRVYIPFLNRPYMLFDRDEWLSTIKPYSSNSGNALAYDSYNWVRTFTSDAYNSGWSANEIDPRGKKGRENGNNCFINNYASSTACTYARDHLLGWASKSPSGYTDVQAIHELAHIAFLYDMMFSNLTESENDLVAGQIHDICQAVTNLDNTRPDQFDTSSIEGDNGKGFGSGMATLCYGVVGMHSSNPTMIHEEPQNYYGGNVVDDWMSREESYLKSFKDDPYAKYQEDWLYKFYSQYHLVENFLFESRFGLNNITSYQNALNSMGLEMLTDTLDFTYNGDSLRSDENQYLRGVQRGDSNSYENIGSDSIIDFDTISYYGVLTNDSDLASGLLYLRNKAYSDDYTASRWGQTAWYIYPLMRDNANGNASLAGLKNFYFDNANDIVTFRDGYTYSNDTVIQIDGGEERGGGHSQVQGYYVYALGEPFLDFEQVPLDDDVRLGAYKNNVIFANYTSALYSSTCGTVGGDYNYLGSSSCPQVGSYPDYRQSSIEYFGNLEDYQGAFSGSIGGVYKYTPMGSTTEPVREYFVKFGDLLVRRAVVVNGGGSIVLDNNLQILEEYDYSVNGENITFQRKGTSKNLTMNTVYANETASLGVWDTGLTASDQKTGSSGLNVSYRRIGLQFNTNSADWIRSYHWFEGSDPLSIAALATTDKGVSDGSAIVGFDTNGDGLITLASMSSNGWALAYNSTHYSGFNVTQINDSSNNVLLDANVSLSATVHKNPSGYVLSVNTNVPDTYNDQPRDVEVTLDVSGMTNSTGLSVVDEDGTFVSSSEGIQEVTFTVSSDDALNKEYTIIGASPFSSGVTVTLADNYFLNSTGGRIDSFNDSTLVAIEKMVLNYTIDAGNRTLDDWYFNFTADGLDACARGNKFNGVCFNYDDANSTEKWVQFLPDSESYSFDGRNDFNTQGDGVIYTKTVVNSSFWRIDLTIDEHYNPNIIKPYGARYNFSDVKWQDGVNQRISGDTFIWISAQEENIPFSVLPDRFKLDIRVNYTTGSQLPDHPLDVYTCFNYSVGDPALISNCALLCSKSPAEFQDDGTKLRCEGDAGYLAAIGAIPNNILLKTDEHNNNKYYYIKSFKSTASNYTPVWKFSNDEGVSYSNTTDGYESEMNVNYFNNGADPTRFVGSLYANTSDDGTGSSLDFITMTVDPQKNYAPLCSFGNITDGSSYNLPKQFVYNIVDPNDDNVNVSVGLYVDDVLNTTLYVANNISPSSLSININDSVSLGDFELRATVVESNTSDGFSDLCSINISLVDIVEINEVSISPSIPYDDESLSGYVTISNNATTTVNYTYSWFVNGVAVKNGSSNGVTVPIGSYLLDTLADSFISPDDVVIFSVTVSDALSSSGYSNSSSVTVLDRPISTGGGSGGISLPPPELPDEVVIVEKNGSVDCGFVVNPEFLVMGDDLTSDFVIANPSSKIYRLGFSFEDFDNVTGLRVTGYNVIGGGASNQFAIKISDLLAKDYINNNGFVVVSADGCYDLKIPLTIDVGELPEKSFLDKLESDIDAIGNDTVPETNVKYFYIFGFVSLASLIFFSVRYEGGFWAYVMYFFLSLLIGLLITAGVGYFF